MFRINVVDVKEICLLRVHKFEFDDQSYFEKVDKV
jgi:hypothetical protein